MKRFSTSGYEFSFSHLFNFLGNLAINEISLLLHTVSYRVRWQNSDLGVGYFHRYSTTWLSLMMRKWKIFFPVAKAVAHLEGSCADGTSILNSLVILQQEAGRIDYALQLFLFSADRCCKIYLVTLTSFVLLIPEIMLAFSFAFCLFWYTRVDNGVMELFAASYLLTCWTIIVFMASWCSESLQALCFFFKKKNYFFIPLFYKFEAIFSCL